MSRRKQSNPKPSKRPFSELLIELAKSLNLPEDLSLKPRKPVCCSSLKSHEQSFKDDLTVNGLNELTDELKPKQTNKSRSKDHINTTVDEVYSSKENSKDSLKENSIDDLVKIEQDTIGRKLCNGELNKNENNFKYNECSQIVTRLDKNCIDDSTDDLNNNINCNQNCCALFSIYSERKLIKGHRFGPYSTRKLISKDDLNKQTSTDKENRFNKIDFYQVQEPAGFWLKIIRTSSKPTAFLHIKENELSIEILEDMSEESELCLETKYQFETISKGLNRLSTTTMITDEMLEQIIEEETNGLTDKQESIDDTLNLNKSPVIMRHWKMRLNTHRCTLRKMN